MTGKLGKTSVAAIVLCFTVVVGWAEAQKTDPATVSTRRKGRWSAPQTGTPRKAPPANARLSDRLRAMRRGETERSGEPVPALPPATPTGRGASSAFQPAATRPGPPSPRKFNPSVSGEARPLQLGARPVASLGRAASTTSSEGASRQESAVPELYVELIAPRRVTLHRPATWKIRVENRGDRATPAVEVAGLIPASATLAGTDTDSGTVVHEQEAGPAAGQLVRWTLPGVPPRQASELQVEIIPREARGLDVQVEWHARPEPLASTTEVLEPKIDLAVSGPSELSFGQVGTFTVTIYNPGTGPAENVTIQIAAGESRAQPRKIGTLAAGEQKTIHLDMTANQAGRLAVTAAVTADGELHAEAEHFVVVRRAKLVLALTGPKMQYAGTPATYDLVVGNQGDGAARNAEVSVALPAGAKLVAASTGAQVDGRTVRWNVGELGPGTQRRMQLRCVLAKSGRNTFEAQVGAGESTARTAAVTQVELVADLKLLVNDPQGPQPVGEEVEYQITITNRGSKVARDVRVMAFFSEDIEPTKAVGHGHQVATGHVKFDPIPEIRPGQTMTLKVTAKATRAGSHQFRAEVQCEDIDTKLAGEETTRFFR